MLVSAYIRVKKIATHVLLRQSAYPGLPSYAAAPADPARAAWDQEFVNLSGQPLLELVTARLRAVQPDWRPRAGQTLCVRVLLSAGPEVVTRDEQGQAVDVRASPWLTAARQFAQRRWGANLVGCQLLQQESRPYLLASVVPLNVENRLSARDMFALPAFHSLQAAYTAALAELLP